MALTTSSEEDFSNNLVIGIFNVFSISSKVYNCGYSPRIVLFSLISIIPFFSANSFWVMLYPWQSSFILVLKSIVLRKYSTKDLIIYSICVSEPKEEWEECLNEYSLKNRGIECIYASDYFGKDNLQKIRKQWKIDRMPYYLLLNRKGQIVDFGTTARPSNPQFVSRIDDALK